MVALLHGLDAYCYDDRSYLERAMVALSGVELACSDRPVGGIGILFTGIVYEAYGRDVWSYVGDSGRRRIGDIHDPSPHCLPIEDDGDMDITICGDASYPEVFASCETLCAVWYRARRNDAPGDLVQRAEQAKILAAELGVRCVQVTWRTRARDIFRSRYQPTRYDNFDWTERGLTHTAPISRREKIARFRRVIGRTIPGILDIDRYVEDCLYYYVPDVLYARRAGECSLVKLSTRQFDAIRAALEELCTV